VVNGKVMEETIRNTFENGVVTDSAILVQPSNSIFASMNGTLINISKGVYQWVPLKGNTFVVSFPNGYQPIAWWSFPTEIIFWLCNGLGYGIVGSVEFDEGWTGTFTQLYFSKEFNWSIQRPLRVLGYEENENIKRVYFSDRVNEPWTLNLKQLTLHTLTLDDYSELLDFHFYTVISGYTIVTEIATSTVLIYNAGDAFLYDSNLFTYSHDASVRLFVPLEQLKWQPNVVPGLLSFDSKIAGNLLYGNYKIGYRYGTYSGFVSPVILSGTYAITKNNSAANDPDLYQGTQGDSHLLNSQFGLRFKMNNYDPNFDYIELIAIHSISGTEYENGLVVTTVSVLQDNSELTLDFTSFSGYGNITVNDILLNPVPIRAVADLTTIKKQLAVTNFKERKEVALRQKMNVTVEEELYRLLTDMRGYPDYTDTSSVALTSSLKVVQTHDLVIDQMYRLDDATCSYHGLSLIKGDIIKPTVAETVAEHFTPVFARKTYKNWTTGIQYYETVELKEWLDYKDPILATNASGFWGNTDVYLCIVFYDKKMIPFFGRYLKKFHTSSRNMSEADRYSDPLTLLKVNAGEKWSINVLSLVLSDLDLTDVIDLIGGYSICMIPAKNPIISEGWIEAIQHNTDNLDFDERFPYLSPLRDGFDGSVMTDYYARRKNWYFYVSPDYLFENKSNPQFLEGDSLRIERYQQTRKIDDITVMRLVNPLSGIYTDTRGIIEDNPSAGVYAVMDTFTHYYQKNYAEVFPINATAYGQVNKVLKNYKIAIDKVSELHYDETAPAIFFKNSARVLRLSEGIYEVGGPGILLKTEKAEDDTILGVERGFGSFANETEYGSTIKAGITVVQQIRTSPEIGQSTFDLEKQELIQITPIQIIDPIFKAAIYKSSTQQYLVSELQIFGGGCFVNLFDHQRMMIDHDQRNGQGSGEAASFHASDSLIIPLQSKFNFALRSDRHFAKNRTWDEHFDRGLGEGYLLSYPEGIGFNNGRIVDCPPMPGMFEKFFYDDAYNNLGESFRFPMLPANYIDQESFIARIRYSLHKIAGETIDSFRKFLTNNFIDLDSQNGEIKNIDGTTGKFFYWQLNAIGYIPVEERELIPSSIGAPIQLGIGGTMERNDDLDTFHGNQHTFGMIKTPKGFIWIDFLRNDALFMTYGGGIKNISLDNEYSWEIKNKHPGIQTRDNPFYEGGISCGYDPDIKIVFFTFYTSTDGGPYQETIGIHVDALRLMGHFNWFPKMFVTFKNKMFTHLMGWDSGTHTEIIYQLPTVENGYLYNFHAAVDPRKIANNGWHVPKKISTETIFGALYNWFAANDSRNIAPVGWHMSTDEEWLALFYSLGSTTKPMKSVGNNTDGTGIWNKSPNPATNEGTNSSGMNIFPTGVKSIDGTFNGQFDYSNFWTTGTQSNITKGKYRNFGYNGITMYQSSSEYSKKYGFNVRLVKDVAIGWTAGDKMTDYDGNTYDTKLMPDGKVWMVENLRVQHYRNGDPILIVDDPTAWSVLLSGAMCFCQSGPTTIITDFGVLCTYLGGYAVTGGKLKEVGLTHWDTPNTGATDEVAFKGRGHGYRDAATGVFLELKMSNRFHSVIQYDISNSFSLQLLYNSAQGAIGFTGKRVGHSVRLVRDVTTLLHGQTGTYIGNDGKIYGTICIGTQEWTEPLMETEYNDHSPIPNVTDNGAWAALTTGARCAYDNDETIAGIGEVTVITTIVPNGYVTKLYMHGSNNIGLFYGLYQDSYIDIIVTAKNENVKFDVLQFITGTKLFDEITYYYNYKETGLNKFDDSITENCSDTRYYFKFGEKWKGTVPLCDTGRITGMVILLRCKLKSASDNQKDIALLELKTLVRKYKL
jgi:uncharacterized protein (TIGR02145 family)